MASLIKFSLKSILIVGLWYSPFQDYNKFKRELEFIYTQVEESLPKEDDVEYLKDDVKDLLSDVDYFLKREGDLSNSERSKLFELKNEIEALANFFYVIDKTNSQIEIVDFFRIIDKIGGQISIIATNTSCAQILKVQIGDYHALFFENLSTSISYKVSYEFLDKRYGLISKSGEMGLIRKNVRHIVNSREDNDFNQLKFHSLKCQEIDNPF